LLDLQNEITLNHVLDTLLRWALNFGCELPSIDALIDLKSTGITCIDSHLHARLDIAASGDNTLDGHEPSNRTGLDLSHLDEGLFRQSASWYNLQMVVSLELWRDSHL
jgi:hypothetical protein